MSPHSQISDYSRYFSLRQKVYLVNMSAERNNELYESLSGEVTSSVTDMIEMIVIHGDHGIFDKEVGVATYKLTSEAMGSGIQVLGDLIEIVGENVFKFRMHGTLEMFQRRTASRVDISTKIFQQRGNFSLAYFKTQWTRIIEYLRKNGSLPGLVFQDTGINLSVGGIGLTVDAAVRTTPLSMFFIKLDEGLPVCAIAESIWEKQGENGIRCGYRFVHILKTDQERINQIINSELCKSGQTGMDFKRDWVLVDRMVMDASK